jgi:glycosyltransferase involved in cell wall biosynthesis
MVVVSGMERMTFEVLRILKENGAEVHCILNDWENHRIRELAESIGATWSTGYYRYTLRRTRNPWRILQAAWSTLRTSGSLLRDSARLHATHVLIPEFGSVLRNAPALLLLRAFGVRILFRLANAPDRGRFYEILWRWGISPFVAVLVANSEFSLKRCLEQGIPSRKCTLIRNAVSARSAPVDPDVLMLVRARRTLLCVGQIAPFKGTHIAVEATMRLLTSGADVQLVVVGPWPHWPPETVEYFRGLQAKVELEGYGNEIKFVGSQSNVPALMRAGFLLVAPILQEETFGNVILEAKSVGLPVVGFKRGAIPELVEHKQTGYLCESADAKGLEEGVAYFLDSMEAWNGARQKSLRFFDQPECPYRFEVFARDWCALFSVRI